MWQRMAAKPGSGIAGGVAADLWERAHGWGGCVGAQHGGAAWWRSLVALGAKGLMRIMMRRRLCWRWHLGLHARRGLLERGIKRRKIEEIRRKTGDIRHIRDSVKHRYCFDAGTALTYATPTRGFPSTQAARPAATK